MPSSAPTARKKPSPRGLALAAVVAAAAVLTALNAAKPLHVDDIPLWYYAERIAEHPLSPYDFEILWDQRPQSAMNPIAPPVLLYWWGAGIRLFGQTPAFWKLWLFPVALILSASTWSLLRRFARGLEHPLLWAVMLSPAVLPSLNLMLDVPNLALGLAAVVLFMKACDRNSPGGAALAGVVCGLAMQTKWTSLALPGVLLAYALLYRRLRLWLLATGVAGLLFVSWEAFIAFRHGESHFLHQLGINNPLLEKNPLTLPLVTYVGGLAPAFALVGLIGLRASRKTVLAAAALVILGFVAIAVVPAHLGGVLRNPMTGRPWKTRIDTPIFLAMGGFVWSVVLAGVFRLCRPLSGRLPWRVARQRASWFLAAWLALEILSYYVFSPFGAARRVIVLVVVMAVVTGRLASRAGQSRRRGVWWASAFGVALGLLYYAVDLAEAVAAGRAAHVAAEVIRFDHPGANVWFSGFWSFEYAAYDAGMKPLLPDRSVLMPGDWLVVMEIKELDAARYAIDPAKLSLVERFEFGDRLPLSTVPCFFIGRRPLEHQDGPRFLVRVYRVKSEFRPTRLPDRGSPQAPAAAATGGPA